MSAPLTSEQITAVYVRHADLFYTCQRRGAGFTCGKCGHGALGLEPKEGDRCNVCKVPVAGIRRGTPEPLMLQEHYL